jgi:ribosomal protein L40E
MSNEKHYEMQWDCKYCGTTKLLGKTHRFCPNCGAAQDPDTRYFPSDDEKVAVEDHVFVGKDKICASCSTLNSASAEFCMQCGAPMSGAKAANTLSDRVAAQGQQFASSGSRDLSQERFDKEMERVGVTQKPKSGPNWVLYGVIAVVALVIIGALVAIFWQQDASAYVSGHSWERIVNVEQYSAIPESAWCDAMPAGAYSITRREEQRSSRQVPDGEECSTRRIDNGDGTFTEREECRTVYRDEPVYDDRCYFTVNRWVFERAVNASGASLNDEPRWPSANISQPGTCVGCEREGTREDHYRVELRQGENTYTCDVNEELWRNMPIESTWEFKVGVVTGRPDCGSLKPAGSAS